MINRLMAGRGSQSQILLSSLRMRRDSILIITSNPSPISIQERVSAGMHPLQYRMQQSRRKQSILSQYRRERFKGTYNLRSRRLCKAARICWPNRIL
jgi:hypothetical protein